MEETPLEGVGLHHQLQKDGDVEILEHDKSGNVQRRWLHKADKSIVPVVDQDKSNGFFSVSAREWRKVLSDAFLPVGFPHSVSEDYLAYQTYDSLQAFFSTITALLANRALLQGLGVGDANSSATFALLLTILKDAMSRVATIVFAHRFGLRIEPDAKRYRFLADLFNDTAFFLELWSPFLGSWGKVAALSVGEALRALCGVAAGASKAALSVHFAKHDNLAELNAKEASQETAVGLVGLLVGTFVVKYVEDHTSVVALTVLLVLAHLWMNYLGVRCVQMNTFNRQRATIVYSEYLHSGKILTPAEVSARESIVFWYPIVTNFEGDPIAVVEFAKGYKDAMEDFSPSRDVTVLDGTGYSMFICKSYEFLPRVRLLLSAGTSPQHAIRAWFEAMDMAWHWESPKDDGKWNKMLAKRIFKGRSGGFSVPTPAFEIGDLEWIWERLVQKGWSLETQAFETEAPVRLSFRAMDRKKE
ncbi:hypothetical protein S40293_04339 [Stachybotrys chartarum IBT 40293]|nr:hypothetical protein S40293_04339 [Stachybotrys chartarum IBT 40293]